MIEEYDIDCLVLGAGVAGIATGRAISFHHKNVHIIERNISFAEETSSRNSEVIHAGIYYKKDSLKRRFCIEGKEKLYAYLDDNKIPHKKIGKFIISTSPDDEEKLDAVYKNALDAGIQLQEQTKLFKEEYKFINSSRALFSETSGILDSHSFMSSMIKEFYANDGKIYFRTDISGVRKDKDCFIVSCSTGSQKFNIKTKFLVNCLGLKSIEFYNQLSEKKLYPKYIKGDYYSYSGKEKISHLIYPVPTKDSLGLHITKELDGNIKFGPSAYPIDEISYEINEHNKEDFVNRIYSYWPGINKDNLFPSYSGIRPKIKDFDDFFIDCINNGASKSIHVLGYDSPGLTSSLALAEHISKKYYL